MERVFPFFFFNDTATTEIYTLSLHDALPISRLERLAGTLGLGEAARFLGFVSETDKRRLLRRAWAAVLASPRSEEHTSELQSLAYLVCRLLLEKKNIATCFAPRSPVSVQSRT